MNAIIVASSFILTFARFSESGENRRRDDAKQRLKESKGELEKIKKRLASKYSIKNINDEYDDLINQPPMEYRWTKWGLFSVLITSLLFHIIIIIHPFPDLKFYIAAFIGIFTAILVAFGLLWRKKRKETDNYVEKCKQLKIIIGTH